MTDKDLTERDVLAKSFPSAQLLICLYHTFRSFRWEIAMDKMGINSGQRNFCLDMLQNMAYATSEKYLELYTSFKTTAPSPVLEYFNEQWHPIKDQRVMGMKYSTGNFLNNRLESLNPVIARYSTLKKFVDNIFFNFACVTIRAWSQSKHSCAKSTSSISFHTDPASLSYMQYLTPYAYNFLAKQITLKDKITLTNGSEIFITSHLGKEKYKSVQCHVSVCHGNLWDFHVNTFLLQEWMPNWICLMSPFVTRGGQCIIRSHSSIYGWRWDQFRSWCCYCNIFIT